MKKAGARRREPVRVSSQGAPSRLFIIKSAWQVGFFTVKPCAQVSLFKNYSDQNFLPECELAFFVKIHLNSIGKLYISLEYLL